MARVQTQQDTTAAFDGLVDKCLRGEDESLKIKTPFDFTTISSVQVCCAPPTAREEHHFTLSLGMDEDDTNLEHLLLKYFKTEDVQDYCHACELVYPPATVRGTAKRTLTMQSPPLVLAIQLKRFRRGCTTSRKLSNAISYPLELQRWHVEYKLLAVAMHHGAGANNGHCTAFVRYGRNWFLCNDDSVSPVNNFVRGDGTEYMLFYIRGGA
jgi:ubiquitin C-terminal hydrolase